MSQTTSAYGCVHVNVNTVASARFKMFIYISPRFNYFSFQNVLLLLLFNLPQDAIAKRGITVMSVCLSLRHTKRIIEQ